MVIEQRPRERHRTGKSPKHIDLDWQEPTAAPASPQSTAPNWQQRRQELIRRERAMAAVFGLVSLAGTLVMLYIAAQASATDEGYRRSDLRRQIREIDAENLRLQTEIRRRENGNAIGTVAVEKQLVRTPEGIHYFGDKP